MVAFVSGSKCLIAGSRLPARAICKRFTLWLYTPYYMWGQVCYWALWCHLRGTVGAVMHRKVRTVTLFILRRFSSMAMQDRPSLHGPGSSTPTVLELFRHKRYSIKRKTKFVFGSQLIQLNYGTKAWKTIFYHAYVSQLVWPCFSSIILKCSSFICIVELPLFIS